MPVERSQVAARTIERVHRDAHCVVELVGIGVLIEVVADARPMVQQHSYRHPIVDERQLIAEQFPNRRIKVEESVGDHRQHADSCHGLGAAGDPKSLLGCVHNSVGAISEAIRMCTQVAVAFDPDHPAERVLHNEPIENRSHSDILPDTPPTADERRQHRTLRHAESPFAHDNAHPTSAEPWRRSITGHIRPSGAFRRCTAIGNRQCSRNV